MHSVVEPSKTQKKAIKVQPDVTQHIHRRKSDGYET